MLETLAQIWDLAKSHPPTIWYVAIFHVLIWYLAKFGWHPNLPESKFGSASPNLIGCQI
jgi:hypothetical protein